MVLLAAMFTRKQHIRINALAVFALLIGLVAAVPHYGHADVLHDVTSHSHITDDSVIDDTSDDEVLDNDSNGNAEAECDHGCHLGHHFNGLLGGGQSSFTPIAKQSPDSIPQNISLIFKRRDLRPPITQIS
jgi:hypothetical protein